MSHIQDVRLDRHPSVPQQGLRGGGKVFDAAGGPYSFVDGEIANLAGNARTAVSIPDGAGFLRVRFRGLASPEATLLYVVFNALNDVDADAKIGTAGQRKIIEIDGEDEWLFFPPEMLTRIDFLSNASGAEGGTTLVIYSYGVDP